MLDLGTLVGYIELDDQKFSDTVDKLPAKLGGAKIAMTAAAALLAAGIGAAIATGIEQGLELDGARSQITAELGLSAEESGRIGAVAGKLYADAYGQSIEEVNSAVGTVVTSISGMRDATSESLEAMTAKALNFSKTFEVDVGRSTQIVGQLVKSGLARDANEGFDLLTATLQKVPKAVREDVLDAADEYGPFFASIGMDGEQAFSLLASSADRGMYGIDKAGDAVKEFTIRASDLNDTGAQSALAALGLSGEAMGNALLAGGDSAATAFATIVSGLQGVKDPAQQAALATSLFGTPLEDLGKDQIPGFLNSLSGANDVLGETVGAADAMGEALNGNAKTSWAEMSRSWDLIIGQAGQALVPVLKLVADTLNENPAVMQIVAAALGVLSIAFIGVTVATWAMNTALLANPITWIILGIVALIAAIILLIMNWDSVVKFLGDAWAGFIGWFTGVMDGFLGWWGGIWDGLLGGIAAGWEAVIAWFAGIPGAIGAFFAGVGDWLAEAGMNLLRGLATGIALGFLALVYLFTQFPTDLMNWLAGAGEWLLQTGLNLLTGLGTGIINGWNWIVQFFTTLPDKLWAFFVQASVWLVLTGIQILNGLLTGIVNGWNGLVAWFQSIPGAVVGFLASAGAWLVGAGRNIISGLLNGVQAMWSGFIGFLQGIPGAVTGFFSGIGSWLYNAGRDLINGLLNGVKSLAGTIGNFFLGLLPSWIVGPFKAALGIKSPSTVFAKFGRNIAQGIVVGLDDEQDALNARVGSLVSVPTATAATLALSAAGGYGAGSRVATSSLTINGNVGWDAEEVARQNAERQRQAAALAGIDELVGVA